MKKLLGLAFACALAGIVAACGGGGGGGPLISTTQYAGLGTVLGEDCAYAVGVITTRSGSASNAEFLARQTCEDAATTAASSAGVARDRCIVDSGTECAAVAVGINNAGICRIVPRGAASLGSARSEALGDCRSLLGSTANCELLVSGCPSGSPSTRVWMPDSSRSPGDTTLPSEPQRTTAPQASGSDWSSVEVAGAGTTTYLSVLNSRSGTVTYRAGTWFEPKDGRYQRMIVTQTTTVQPGQVVRVPTACMQRDNPIPASGARFFSSPKQASGSVQQCQTRCLSGSQSIQTCVWGCERSTSPPPPPPPPPSQIVFETDDTCNDGRDVTMRFFYYRGSSNFINYATGNLVARGSDTVTRIPCNFSNVDRVCYGARLDLGGGRHWRWGLDIDRSDSCTDCCYTCTPGMQPQTVRLNFGCPR